MRDWRQTGLAAKNAATRAATSAINAAIRVCQSLNHCPTADQSSRIRAEDPQPRHHHDNCNDKKGDQPGAVRSLHTRTMAARGLLVEREEERIGNRVQRRTALSTVACWFATEFACLLGKTRVACGPAIDGGQAALSWAPQQEHIL